MYRQTYRNLKIVVVDDGSTDGTKEKLNRHTDRIRYVHQENKGTGAARNTGLREARGELVAFLDNDDLWLPDKIEKQVEAFAKFTGSNYTVITAASNERSSFEGIFNSNVISSATGAMVKKRLVKALGGFGYRARGVRSCQFKEFGAGRASGALLMPI